MDDSQPGSSSNLDWSNVGLGLSFILFDAVISAGLGLGVGTSLVTAALRCVVQLSVVALILQKVFDAKNIWAVAGITCLLNLLGTIEAVVNKSKRRYRNMFLSVLFGLLFATIPVSIIGTRFAMSIDPFWKPERYIPVVGMLCGNAVSGVVVATSYVLKELHDNRDKVEMYLSFGASRMEACTPIAKEALRLALTPAINQMSVMGIIAIPGMMTGAILGGSSVQQAARLQMIIIFMISASTALASIVTVVLTLAVVVDGEHRVRDDRVDGRQHAVYRARHWVISKIGEGLWSVWTRIKGVFRREKAEGEEEEHDRLLG